METWERFNNELNNIKSVIDYSVKIENQVQKLLSEIFNKEVYKAKENINRFIYDFVIELQNYSLYCEIKVENTSLKRYWDKYTLSISEEISKINSLNHYTKIKYLLILIDSHDSIAKMDLKPIYPNILVINLKMLFEIRNYVKRNEIYSRLLEKLFEFSSGVLYDSLFKDFYDIKQYIKTNRLPSKLQDFDVNDDILDTNLDKIFENFLRIERSIDQVKIREIINSELNYNKEVTSEDIIRILEIDQDESEYYKNLIYKEESRIEEKAKAILKEVKNPSVNILIKEFSLTFLEANEIGNYMLKKGYIEEFPKYISTIILITPPLQAFSSFYETYLINNFNKNNFRFIKMYNYLKKENFEWIIKFSDIIVVDITIYNPELLFFLGLIEKNKKEIIITYQSLYAIPKFLGGYKNFTYKLNDYNTIKFDLVDYIRHLTSGFNS